MRRQRHGGKWNYHYAAPDSFDHIDRLSVWYEEGSLVGLLAERNYSTSRAFDPSSGQNSGLAYRLSIETGQEHRETGPEFERVFDCRAGRSDE